MLKINRLRVCLGWLAAIMWCGTYSAPGAGWKVLAGHVPHIVSQLTPEGLLLATNRLTLAIGLPLHDSPGLADFLTQVYDPASPNYRHFLSPTEFTARFGPTEGDYAAVENFARTNGLTITGRHDSRILLDVNGPVSAIEKAFQITLRTYRHPTEARTFFAPDTEPRVDARLPIVDISGLNNLTLPRSKSRLTPPGGVPQLGSGVDGTYFGGDFRAAYVPGTSLTGAGQTIGLFEFDGFYSNDIAAYETAAGLSNIPVQTVLIDGVSGVPGYAGLNDPSSESSLDIELSMAMAPGLAKVVVFEGTYEGAGENDILDAMAASNQVEQLSCSWEWSGGPSATTDGYFQKMEAQGQSFFNACGDKDAFTVGDNSTNGVDNTMLANAPASSPYITQVGGTSLTTGNNGAWAGETVWNAGGGEGSSGGVSSYYPMPDWQTNVNVTANGGSAKQRNSPDVALTADNILVFYGSGGEGDFEGTSCAAPLWAGFMALANQQAAEEGGAPIGFLNPYIYSLARSAQANSTYANYFNDITSGNNEWTQSPTQYVAGVGYDLCTGLGTPAGTNLINVLTSVNDPLHVLPGGSFNAIRVVGGPFVASAPVYDFTNEGATSLAWKIFEVPAWLTPAATGGTLAGFSQASVVFNFNSAASNLVAGSYTGTLGFSNVTTQVAQYRSANLQVLPVMQVGSINGFFAGGPFGGPFSENLSTLMVSNLGSANFNWSLINTSSWLTVSPANGTVPAETSVAVALAFSTVVSNLAPNVYSTELQFTNLTDHTVQLIPATLSIGQNLVGNGGFETGDFTDWTLVGSGTVDETLYNGVIDAGSFSGAATYIHSGNYAVVLGQSDYLATLSQTVATVPGENYLVSLWLINPGDTPTQQFQVNWGGDTICNILNPATFGWTNLEFVVGATETNTVLQFGAENDYTYFGLDDISVSAIPTVGFSSIQQLTNTYEFTWGATTGLVYQVQYKTNLLQPNWINLGSAIPATANVLSISDTNALLLSPERFYRLGVSP
jgi:hypothetical protein